MPHPEDKPELPRQSKRRPSHFRKKRRETTTKVVRVLRTPAPDRGDIADVEDRHVVQRPQARQGQWSEVVNPAPTLPDPILRRPIPPPAPLPSEALAHESSVPAWLDDRQRRKRVEDIVGTIALALMVAAMLIAMWLRMTGT
ncbi:MAG: hypothetical protein WBM74_15505 [Polyangiales bacterium]